MKTPQIITKEEWEMIFRIISDYNTQPYSHYDYYLGDDSIDEEDKQQLLIKISLFVSREFKSELKKEELRKKYHPFSSHLDRKVYDTLKKALIKQITLEIKYFKMESADFMVRKIDVYYTNARYTIAYCHMRKAIRKFRTGRITSARETGIRYNIPNNFDKNKYL
jgi:predicted DNA-binding transcriptional regulator YafY